MVYGEFRNVPPRPRLDLPQAAVDFDKVDCPVLVLSGAEDRAVPFVTARKIAQEYGTRAEFHEILDHAHFMFIEPGWEKIAALCAKWMSGLTEPGD